jgi:hypothetical protein
MRQQTVSKAILKYVRNLPALTADDLRRLEAERLDALTAALAPAIAKGDPRSIQAAVLFPNEGQAFGPRQASPTDVEMLRRIQELEPIEKPAGADAVNENLLSITDSSSDGDGSSTTDATSEIEPYSYRRTESDAARAGRRGFIRVR